MASSQSLVVRLGEQAARLGELRTGCSRELDIFHPKIPFLTSLHSKPSKTRLKAHFYKIMLNQGLLAMASDLLAVASEIWAHSRGMITRVASDELHHLRGETCSS
ncbi:hypothetical protein MTR_5g061960 [Medicago truncatula]|uniref:Uncharacterized protein n=1 Tax=Medicago truncatula TaxID=3880 RepID=G7KA32_MEDTR|nr:hypothetical protein MTR_5g061960 [Medicago truncatula]